MIRLVAAWCQRRRIRRLDRSTQRQLAALAVLARTAKR